jgi:FkbM family methyltransferase
VKRALRKLKHYYTNVGIRGAIAFLAAKVAGRPLTIRKSISEAKHPLYLRVATTDVSVYRQIFVERHYDIPLDSTPGVIIDAGANIGLSSVFFALKYPAARILAIEPDKDNFEMLSANTREYSNIRPLNAALWSEEGEISLVDSGEGSHGFQTRKDLIQGETPLRSIKAVTIPSVKRDYQFSKIDLLKIDIEGAEKEVFETSKDWINDVQAIMAEVHEHLKPGASQAFETATALFAKTAEKGETVFCQRGS